MIIEYAWKPGFDGGWLDTNELQQCVPIKDDEVHLHFKGGSDSYIRAGGYITVNGVHISGSKQITRKLHEIVSIERLGDANAAIVLPSKKSTKKKV
jgi:hypothetical protein